MRDALKQGFPPFTNVASLKSAIKSVCKEFGKVTYLEILPATLRPNLQCLCALCLDSEGAQYALRAKLSTVDYDNRLWFFVDVHDDWTRLRDTPSSTKNSIGAARKITLDDHV